MPPTTSAASTLAARSRPARLWFMRVTGATRVAFALGAAIGVAACPARVRRFEYYAAPLSTDAYASLAARPGWEASTVDVAPGVTLRGLVHRPRSVTSGAAAPWVLFHAGNDPQQLEHAQAFLDRLRGDRGWGTAAWTYRGFDGSGGTPGRAAIEADALVALDHLCATEHVARADVRLVGFSLGSYVAASVAAAAARSGARARSLTLLASPAMIDVARDRYDTRPLLADVPAPALVVHGAADASLPVEEGRTVAATLGARARYVEVPGAGHTALLESDAALEAVRAFVEAP